MQFFLLQNFYLKMNVIEVKYCAAICDIRHDMIILQQKLE